jgi:hypothetical protein
MKGAGITDGFHEPGLQCRYTLVLVNAFAGAIGDGNQADFDLIWAISF